MADWWTLAGMRGGIRRSWISGSALLTFQSDDSIFVTCIIFDVKHSQEILLFTKMEYEMQQYQRDNSFALMHQSGFTIKLSRHNIPPASAFSTAFIWKSNIHNFLRVAQIATAS